MTTERKVLLARPHAFIVADMKPLLAQAGFSPAPLSALEEIAGGAWRSAHGAVISIALSSSIPESAETVFATLRRHAPRIPVLFAGLTDFEMARRTVERIVQPVEPKATVLPIDAGSEHHSGLGRPDVVLYLQKDTLKTAAGTALAERMLRRHFI